MTDTEINKQIVRRFNLEVIEKSNREAFEQIMHKDFINRTPPPTGNDAEAVWKNLTTILKPAFPDLKVEIYDQIAEGDMVSTRKAIVGTHTGELMGIQPTNKKVRIEVYDIVRLKEGKYFEH